jgi:hypothetical protein
MTLLTFGSFSMAKIEAMRPPKLDPTMRISLFPERMAWSLAILSSRGPGKLGVSMLGNFSLK